MKNFIAFLAVHRIALAAWLLLLSLAVIMLGYPVIGQALAVTATVIFFLAAVSYPHLALGTFSLLALTAVALITRRLTKIILPPLIEIVFVTTIAGLLCATTVVLAYAYYHRQQYRNRHQQQKLRDIC